MSRAKHGQQGSNPDLAFVSWVEHANRIDYLVGDAGQRPEATVDGDVMACALCQSDSWWRHRRQARPITTITGSTATQHVICIIPTWRRQLFSGAIHGTSLSAGNSGSTAGHNWFHTSWHDFDLTNSMHRVTGTCCAQRVYSTVRQVLILHRWVSKCRLHNVCLWVDPAYFWSVVLGWILDVLHQWWSW